MAEVAEKPSIDLEELLEREIPCGGNRFPKAHPCLSGAAAEWVNWHLVRCATARAHRGFKCSRCYGEWLTAVMAGTGHARCWCGHRVPGYEAYERL